MTVDLLDIGWPPAIPSLERPGGVDVKCHHGNCSLPLLAVAAFRARVVPESTPSRMNRTLNVERQAPGGR